MKKLFRIIPFLLLMFIIGACTKDLNLPAPEKEPTVTTTLLGTVVDESSNPVDAATVTAYGKTTTTDAQGFFTITNVEVSPDRAYVKVTKTGYFTGSKACAPAANAATQVKITLSSNAPNFTITSSSGGTASLANGSSVQLPVDAVVSSSGSAYSGTINLAVKHLDPSSDDFDNLMPGDLEAIRTDGSSATLYSYGMLNVELTDNAGQPLKLADGKSATLTFPVPASMQGNAPATIPLWYFDETAGIWKEEGTANLVGTNYVGLVHHFSTWNCDQAAFRTTVTGRVVDCHGDPVAGLAVLTGQRQVITNSEGIYTAFVPDGQSFQVSVFPSDNFGVVGTPFSAGPFPAEQTNTLPDLTVTCPGFVTGTIVDCNNVPVPGFVIAAWTGGSNTAVTSKNGTFKIPVLSNQSVTIYAYSNDGFKSIPVNVTSSSINPTGAGQISVCSDAPILNTTFTVSGGIYNNTDFTISQAGAVANYSISNDRTYLSLYDQATSKYFSINFPGNTTGTFGKPNEYLYLQFDNTIATDSSQNDLPFTITDYEPVGGVIQGTYAGSLYDPNSSTTYTITNGRFAIIRGNDQ
jgi:protocatechuate 3,4-dioxygenase beta subunit